MRSDVATLALRLVFELLFFLLLFGQLFLTLFVTVVGCCQDVLSSYGRHFTISRRRPAVRPALFLIAAEGAFQGLL